MKRLISLALALCLALGLWTVPAGAADAASVQGVVQALGIMTGDENGNMNLYANVTRAQFAKMMVAASPYKDTVGDDTGYSLFKDVKRDHWASEYIRIAVEQGWFVGYSDGTFRPDNGIRTEEAATALLRLLGYTSEDLTGVYPSAQLSKYKALQLDDMVSASQGQYLSREDCMYMFYNLMTAQTKSGQVYATTLGYSLTASGEVDYAALVAAELRGPYTLMPGDSLPITTNVTVYRNGQAAEAGDAQAYDVYYYNSNIRTVYLYSNRVTGTYTAATPSTVSPTSVTVAGNTYTIGTSSAAYKLSAMGEFSTGDTVTLLLGMDGTVADVVSVDEVDSVYYGIVLANGNESYTNAGGAIQAGRTVQVACTDGVVRSYTSTSEITVGALVSISWSGGQNGVKRLSERSLSGKVTATKLGSTPFADQVEILDTTADGNYTRVYLSRLEGTTLSSDHVRYYATNSQGEITHLILKDVTGDAYDYGLVTEVHESSQDMSITSSYTYLVNGTVKNYSSMNRLFSITTGGVRIGYEDGAVNSMRNLTSGSISSLTTAKATVKGKTFDLAEDVQVYLYSGGDYSAVNLNTVLEGGYRLTAWYDDFAYPAGGLVRVIVAVKN